MYYETKSFQEIIEIMVSCDRLGLMYVLQKEPVQRENWFGRKAAEIVYKLQVVQYVEEVEENEEENLQRRPSESVGHDQGEKDGVGEG